MKTNVMLLKKYTGYDSLRGTVFVQPKLDGIRAYYSQGILRTRSGKVIDSVPHITNALGTFPGDFEGFDGELYTDELPFDAIAGIVNRTVNMADASKIKFHVFDVMSNDSFKYRTSIITDILARRREFVKNAVCKVATYRIDSKKDYADMLRRFIDDGYEGIVVRHTDRPYEFTRSSQVLKYKPHRIETATIISIDKGSGKYYNVCGSLVCTLKSNNKLFSVGSGLNDEQRQKIVDNPESYINREITVKFQELTQYGIPRFPVIISLNP
jgi:DNA ligase-1